MDSDRPPSFREIAAILGVSPATVSKAIRGRPDISDATRTRVLGYLDEQGIAHAYRVLSHTVDLHLENLQGAWSSEIIRGIQNACETYGLALRCTQGIGSAHCDNWVRESLKSGTRGLISVVSRPSSRVIERARSAGVATALIDPADEISDRSLITCLTFDNWEAGFQAAGLLASNGHRKVGVISGELRLHNARQRMSGWLAGCEANAIAFDSGNHLFEGDYSALSGAAGAVTLMKRDQITAIFAFSDDAAVGAMSQLNSMGLRVPKDVSVVGFDDNPMSQWLVPALTTIRQPLFTMGYDAVARAIMDGSNQDLKYQAEIVSRGSVLALV